MVGTTSLVGESIFEADREGWRANYSNRAVSENEVNR